jgi:hypothetical protein
LHDGAGFFTAGRRVEPEPESNASPESSGSTHLEGGFDMVRHPIAIAVVTALALTLPAGDAAAQLRFAVAGGPSFPLGSVGDDFGTGWHVQISAGLSVPFVPISVRVDGAYNRFPGEAATSPAHFQLISGTVNGIVSIPSILITPYFIGGLGFYSSKIDPDIGPDSESSDVGANVGLGVRLGLPVLSIFAEARLHNVFSEGDAVRFAPLSVGLHF